MYDVHYKEPSFIKENNKKYSWQFINENVDYDYYKVTHSTYTIPKHKMGKVDLVCSIRYGQGASDVLKVYKERKFFRKNPEPLQLKVIPKGQVIYLVDHNRQFFFLFNSVNNLTIEFENGNIENVERVHNQVLQGKININ